MKNEKLHLVAVFLNLEDFAFPDFAALRHFLKKNLGITVNKPRQYFFITSLNEQQSFRLQEYITELLINEPGQRYFRSSYLTGSYDIEQLYAHLSGILQEKI